MKLIDIVDSKLICPDLISAGKMDVLGELGNLLAQETPGIEAAAITNIMVERERLATTGVGEGVAIPHGKVEALGKILAAVGISRTGIPFDAVDGEPVHIFVALLAPLNSSGDHLRALARVSRLLKDPSIRSRMMAVRSADELYEILREEDEKY